MTTKYTETDDRQGLPLVRPRGPAEPVQASDFSAGLFWDTDPASLDIDMRRRYVIARVLERGTLEDWRLLRRAYTLPTIIEVAKTLRCLDPKALAFLAVVGRTPRRTFRCFTTKQSTARHWIS